MPGSPPLEGDCTTHFSVVEKHNVVCCTQTAVGSFGSRVVVPGTGVLLSNGMLVFNPFPGLANSIAGFKRGLNNMSPILVTKEGWPFLSIGASRGRRIIDCIAQIILAVLDQGMGIQEAVSAARVDASGRQNEVDARIDPETVGRLSRMGHDLCVVEQSASSSPFARPLGALIHPETGLIHCGVDVFHPVEARAE